MVLMHPLLDKEKVVLFLYAFLTIYLEIAESQKLTVF